MLFNLRHRVNLHSISNLSQNQLYLIKAKCTLKLRSYFNYYFFHHPIGYVLLGQKVRIYPIFLKRSQKTDFGALLLSQNLIKQFSPLFDCLELGKEEECHQIRLKVIEMDKVLSILSQAVKELLINFRCESLMRVSSLFENTNDPRIKLYPRIQQYLLYFFFAHFFSKQLQT